MFGSTCLYLKTISNCSSSIAGYGVHLGLLIYIQEIKAFVRGNENLNERLKDIENYHFYVAESFVVGLEIFSEEVKINVDFKLLKSKLITLAFFFSFGVYYFTLGKNIPEIVQENLENKAFVSGMF
jgi:hypothetical protein